MSLQILPLAITMMARGRIAWFMASPCLVAGGSWPSSRRKAGRAIRFHATLPGRSRAAPLCETNERQPVGRAVCELADRTGTGFEVLADVAEAIQRQQSRVQ